MTLVYLNFKAKYVCKAKAPSGESIVSTSSTSSRIYAINWIPLGISRRLICLGRRLNIKIANLMITHTLSFHRLVLLSGFQLIRDLKLSRLTICQVCSGIDWRELSETPKNHATLRLGIVSQ